ncbi:MAG: undecaprenyl-diphosphate phosphatase [Eubacteriales bacterium]|jgi:undecaprenyl-diphosphatase
MTEILKAILYGIVEGVTEWLPISSTGHLILLNEFLGLNVGAELGPGFVGEFWEMFEVVIQLGAILAVVVMFFTRLNPFSPKKSTPEKKETWAIWFKVIVASIPAAIVGLVLDKVIERLSGRDIEGWLYNAWVVSAALIIYGLLFIIIEKARRDNEPKITGTQDITYQNAFIIGICQMLAIIPGTSRSGSTILGAMLLGMSRSTAAEFSFFMAIPAMAGASLIKMYGFFDYVAESGVGVPAAAWGVLLAACATAFLVSMVAIKFLMDFVRRHTFTPFGVYRIVLGALVLLYFIFI